MAVVAVLAGCQSLLYWPVRPPPPEAAVYGEYLAAQVAALNRNTGKAALYWERVWKRDPLEPAVLEQAVRAHILVGDLSRALSLAQRAPEEILAAAPIARILLLAAGFDALSGEGLQEAEDEDSRLFLSLHRGLQDWAAIKRGLVPESLEVESAGSGVWLYHRAFLYHAAGDEEAAAGLFEQAWQAGDRFTLAAQVYAGLLYEAGRGEEALELARFFERKGRYAPLLRRFSQSLADGKEPQTEPFEPHHGAALVLFLPTLGPVSLGEMSSRTGAIILLRLALLLSPQFDAARLRLSEYLLLEHLPELALSELEGIGQDSPWWVAAQLQRAYILLKQEREALSVALELREQVEEGGRFEAFELGRLFIDLEQYEQAEMQFSRVIGKDVKEGREDWRLFFARGQARDRQGKWPQASEDLQKALELVPDRPEILNYLGYSWLDRGENLREAFALVRRAAAARPDSGAIIDSLGWAYFRLGRYQQAVEQLEQASVLDPADPVVADHLGDAYWRVGRLREARYQWRKALDMEPDSSLRLRINDKLELGLDDLVSVSP